ncbi:unnamed protein product, partial [Hapterophycus canaliculatus]
NPPHLFLETQALYEAGYITYMRTDRPSLSNEAAGVAELAVRDSFGDEFVRKGDAKAVKVKGSQEAHEAIRPALITGGAPVGAEGGLEEQQRALYDLVYRRTLASAMAESEADFTTVSLGADGVSAGGDAGDEV